MIALIRTCFSALPCAVLLATILGAVNAPAAESLTKVKVSPDLQRVIIESSGTIAKYNAFELDRPPRLVIDMDGVLPGKAAKVTPPERTGGLKIQVSESRSGTHVVLDFGGGPVPTYRIRPMDNYLIVFLGEWTAPTAKAPPLSASKPASKSRHQSSKARSPEPSPGKLAGKKISKPSDLTIQSATVSNGIIVLKVADRAKPERLFRINLGVNLDRLGFVSAGIHPLTVNPDSAPSPPVVSRNERLKIRGKGPVWTSEIGGTGGHGQRARERQTGFWQRCGCGRDEAAFCRRPKEVPTASGTRWPGQLSTESASERLDGKQDSRKVGRTNCTSHFAGIQARSVVAFQELCFW